MLDFIDEAILKLICFALRFFQFALSLIIIGGIGQAISNFYDTSWSIPGSYVAVTAMASMTAVWSGLAILFTCCAGQILLGVEVGLDVLSMAFSITETALLSKDALDSNNNWMGSSMPMSGPNTHSLARMSFIVAILL
ncbi:hypothetical protein GQ53DRAFT_753580, partial [Thozetella sp. PMI_491]